MDSVDRAIKELVKIGALEVQARRDASGDQTSNLYSLRLSVPAGEVAAPVRPPGRSRAATVAAPVRHRTITNGSVLPSLKRRKALGRPRWY